MSSVVRVQPADGGHHPKVDDMSREDNYNSKSRLDWENPSAIQSSAAKGPNGLDLLPGEAVVQTADIQLGHDATITSSSCWAKFIYCFINACCLPCCVPCWMKQNGWFFGCCRCYNPIGTRVASLMLTDKRVVLRETSHQEMPGTKTCWFYTCCYCCCTDNRHGFQDVELSYDVEQLMDSRVTYTKDRIENMCCITSCSTHVGESSTVEMDFVKRVGDYLPRWDWFGANKTSYKYQEVTGYMPREMAVELRRALQETQAANQAREKQVAVQHSRLLGNSSDNASNGLLGKMK